MSIATIRKLLTSSHGRSRVLQSKGNPLLSVDVFFWGASTHRKWKVPGGGTLRWATLLGLGLLSSIALGEAYVPVSSLS